MENELFEKNLSNTIWFANEQYKPCLILLIFRLDTEKINYRNKIMSISLPLDQIFDMHQIEKCSNL